MEDTNMKKKTYIQPTIEVETFQGEIIMQIGSQGVNTQLQIPTTDPTVPIPIEEVEEGW